jgi:hypothetical protein
MNATTPLLQCLDWAGGALGLLGAYTLAAHSRFSRYGWWAFMLANLVYIALAAKLGLHGLLAQQIGFVGSSFLGIYRAFIRAPGRRDKEPIAPTSCPIARHGAQADRRIPSDGASS